ncbi:rCG27032 [Rattus norvegicus]|uniref:RCG27032 n=1 Tax=Rattus norvegicus TaxID=10116 RepID=A6HQ25_RAT|nr:rCG27032 [Rattus norvegicus]
MAASRIIPHERCLQLPFPVTDTPLVLVCSCISSLLDEFKEYSTFLELSYSFWTLEKKIHQRKKGEEFAERVILPEELEKL